MCTPRRRFSLLKGDGATGTDEEPPLLDAAAQPSLAPEGAAENAGGAAADAGGAPLQLARNAAAGAGTERIASAHAPPSYYSTAHDAPVLRVRNRGAARGSQPAGKGGSDAHHRVLPPAAGVKEGAAAATAAPAAAMAAAGVVPDAEAQEH